MGLFKRKKEDDRPLIEQVFHGTKENREAYIEPTYWNIIKIYKADWQKFGEMLQKHNILDHNKPIVAINRHLGFDYNNQPLLKITYEQEGNNSTNKKTIVVDRYKASILATRGMGRASDFMINELWQGFSDATIYKHEANKLQNGQNATREENFKSIDSYLENINRNFAIKYGKSKFRYFGYENGIPVFVQDNQGKKERSVLISTAQELILCVSNLVPEEKLYQAKDIEFFKEKCDEIAKRTSLESERGNWAIARDLLAEYLVSNQKTFAKQLKKDVFKQLEQ